MGSFITAKHYAAASAVVPSVAIFIWNDQLWLTLVCLIWFLVVAVLWVHEERTSHRNRMARTIHALQSSSIRTLNHHRHDWMNDLQVLYGYARLGKLEKTMPYMDQIIDRMNTESAIANLGVPSLVSYIQSFRTLTSTIVLDVSIDGNLNLNELSSKSEKIAETLIHTINAYRFNIKTDSYEQSKLRMELSVDGNILHAAFHYDGELRNEQQWKQKITEQLEDAPLKLIGNVHSYNRMQMIAEMRA